MTQYAQKVQRTGLFTQSFLRVFILYIQFCRARLFTTTLIFFLLLPVVNAQQKRSSEDRLAWWHEARFGMFINWGVHSLYGGIYKGHGQARGGAEWIMNRCKIPVTEYREMARQFNPVNYDPDGWVKMAKDAGMKYLVISMKHHDGFVLFDSKAGNWDVVDATPYGKDLLKPLAEACKKQGLKLGIYYSQAVDWTNPGGAAARRLMKEGWPNPDSARIDQYTKEHDGHWDPIQETATFDEYVDRVAVPQVREILTNYGEIAILWWDYGTQMKSREGAAKLDKLLALQPNIITNDRLHPDFPGDTKTPEQAIPEQSTVDGQNWETCMTMNGSWGYRKSDHNWKSSETLIRNLVKISSRGGNYLLNIGPKPDGSFPDENVQRLKEIGRWMGINGEAIYGTLASPLQKIPWGECTKKELKNNTILYLSVFDWPKDGVLLVPGLENKIISAKLLATGTQVQTSGCANGLKINVPVNAPDPVVSVIRLEVKGKIGSYKGTAPKKKMQTGAID
jgi:alpha-L-fucosidase